MTLQGDLCLVIQDTKDPVAKPDNTLLYILSQLAQIALNVMTNIADVNNEVWNTLGSTVSLCLQNTGRNKGEFLFLNCTRVEDRSALTSFTPGKDKLIIVIEMM